MSISRNRIKYLEKQLGVKFTPDYTDGFIHLIIRIARFDIAAARTAISCALPRAKYHIKRPSVDDLFAWSTTPEGGDFWYRMYLSVHSGREWRGGRD